MRQLAKKMESSKSTARHIKSVASDLQAAQVNLLRHQRTDLPPSKSMQKQHSHKHRSKGQKRYSSELKNEEPPYKKRFDQSHTHNRRDRCHKSGDSKHIEGFNCPARKYQCRNCHKHGHFSCLCYKKGRSFESSLPKAHQMQVGHVYMQDNSTCGKVG